MLILIQNKKGFSLIELMVAITFIAVIVTLILSLTFSNDKIRRLNEQKTQALLYSSSALEAVKLVAWDNLVPGDYSLSLVGDNWFLISGSELLDNKFTRTITVSDVYRTDSTNGNVYGDISEAGFLDPDTKKVIVTVSWPSILGSNKQELLETYLYRWQASRWQQNDWVGGSGQDIWSDETRFSSNDTGIDISVPGIVTLKSGFLDWNQATTTATFDTPGNFNDNDVDEVGGIAYLVTENNPSGSEFYVLNVNDIRNPIELSSLNIGDTVTSVVAKGDYAYLSTNRNDAELVVVDISNDYAPQIVETYDISGNTNAFDLAVDETELYLGRGDRLYSFSINDPEDVEYLDSIDVDDSAREVFLAEDYVYIATEDDDKELQIVEVTNPANLNPVGQYNLPGSLKGTDVHVRGTRAYISTQNNGGGSEFFVFDISDPTDPLFIGEYAANETIYSFTIIGPYALLGTNFLNEELIVIDVSFPATINQVSGFDLNGYVLGMSANCSVIYAATSGNEKEFFIISTEVADCGYADLGILESSTFDTGSDQVAYNWIAWTGSEPANTDIKFQIATSNNSSGPWNFVGPDGSSSTYYSTAAQELINYNQHLNQRYIRYKLFLSSQAELQAPILEEVTISYSIYP